MTGRRDTTLGDRTRPARGAAGILLRLLLILIALGVVAHHAAAPPGSHPPGSGHGTEACADCPHDHADPDALLITCLAIGAAALLLPGRPGGVGRRLLPVAARLVPGMPAPVGRHLRAPPPTPELDRLCVLLR